MDKSISATFTSLLTHELTQSPKLIVIKESLLQEVMKRQAMNISDLCDDTVCQVEIGKLVQAQKMVVGELSKMGAVFYLTLEIVDIQSGTVEFSGKEKCACSEDQLELLVAAGGARLRNHFGEAIPIPTLPGGQAFLPVQPSPASPPGAQAFRLRGGRSASAESLLPVQPSAPAQKTFQEFHPRGTSRRSLNWGQVLTFDITLLNSIAGHRPGGWTPFWSAAIDRRFFSRRLIGGYPCANELPRSKAMLKHRTPKRR